MQLKIYVLVLPKPKPKKSRSKQALNSKTVCITDPEELKVKEAKKAVAAEKKMVRIAERAKKKQEKEMEKEKARREKEKRKNHIQEINLSPSGDEDDAECPGCGLLYKEDNSGDSWICCDKCNDWFCFKCSGLNDVNEDFFVNCVISNLAGG